MSANPSAIRLQRLFGDTPRSARHALLRGLRQAVLVTAALVAGYLLMSAAQPTAFEPPAAVPATVEAPTAADLVAENDCWTGQGPEGVIPGHVVVTVDGTPTLGGSRMTGNALAQLFDGADHGLTIHAFCR